MKSLLAVTILLVASIAQFNIPTMATSSISRVSNDYPTIQDAIDAANLGDTIGYTKNVESPTGTMTHEWPMFQHDARHTGYSRSSAPNTNETLWKYKTGWLIRSSPAVVNGRVFVTALEYLDFATLRRGELWCLNESTGSLIWKWNLWGTRSTPAVMYGLVFVCREGIIYALNETNGICVWNNNFSGHDATPTVESGRVYLGTSGGVFCFDAISGSQIWNNTDITGYGDFYFTPAIAGDRMFIGARAYIHCLNKETGHAIWNCSTGKVVSSSPTVANGKVFVGLQTTYDENTTSLYCLDEYDGSLLWKFATNSTQAGSVESSPAVANGMTFFGSLDGCFYCLNENTGTLIWSYDTSDIYGERDRIFASPAVADGKVYVSTTGYYASPPYGYVLCFHMFTGNLIWKYKVDSHMWFGSPAVANGKLFVGSEDYLYAFGESKEKPEPRIVSVTLDKTEVDCGDWVTITVKARNDGDKADEMYISVSLPDNPPVDNIQMVSHDLQDAYILPVGDEVGGDYGTTYPIVLVYPLVEGFEENWETGETKTLQFQVRPPNNGTFRFFVKTTAQENGAWSYDPQSGTKDQQNEYAYVYTVSVSRHRPYSPFQPSGPTSITIRLNESQTSLTTFSTSAIDPDGDQVSIVFDWGDGTTTSTDFHDSGSTIEAQHSWSFVNVSNHGSLFIVRACAVDSHGAKSEWSESLAVSVNIATSQEKWAGYHAYIPSNSFTSISGKWNVPTVTGWGESGTWIGIGGVGKDSPLLQTGTSEFSLDGIQIHTAFFENYPENAITIDPINCPVYAGDTIEASIAHMSGNEWTLTLRNLTPHGIRSPWTWSHTEEWRYPPDQRYADWIHEVKVTGGIIPFTPITFSEASATIGGEDYLLGELPNTQLFRDLVYDAGIQYTNVSSLSDYSEFTIEYVADEAEESVAFFELSSAANLSIFDSEGRHVGYDQTTGDIDLEIPGALWFANQTNQYLALMNPNGNFTLALIGTENGEYHLHYMGFSKGSVVQCQWLNGTISSGQALEFLLGITAFSDGTIESSAITSSGYPIDYGLYIILAVAGILTILIASTMVFYKLRHKRA